MQLRLDKYLADMGIGTRTQVLGREICRGKQKKVENLEMSTVGRGIWQEN